MNSSIIRFGTPLLLALLNSFKIAIACGTHTARFAFGLAVTPLIAQTDGFSFLFGALLIQSVWKYSLIGTVGSFILALHIPTIIAAWYWQSDSYLLRTLAAISCIILFIAHPVGNAAWFYTIYWLIPALSILTRYSIILRALCTSFMAHAVGSVIWLYLYPMTVADFAALMPVVPVERALIAASMVFVHFIPFVLNTLRKNKIVQSHA